eukprot:PhF_6_TR2555/c0_g1_i1/m.4333
MPALGGANSGFIPEFAPFSQQGANYYGSYPLFIADTQTQKPNFRMFDWYLDGIAPSVELGDKLWKNKEGEASWRTNVGNVNMRATPQVITCGFMALVGHWMCSRFHRKTPAYFRLDFFYFFAGTMVYNNFTKWFTREKMFLQDFHRNQEFAQEELRRRRDEQRVREYKYQLQYVNDPVTEFRVKEWEVSDRFR